MDSDEDNNPFAGTTHLYASGIANAYPHQSPPPDLLNAGSQLFGEEFPAVESNNIYSSLPTSSSYEEDSPLETEPKSVHVNPQTQSLSSYTAASKSEHISVSLNPAHTAELPRIVSYGQYRNSLGKYAIGYTIAFEGNEVRRRYSEFDTLRQALVRLFPTLVIPPIPAKHSLINYMLNPIGAQNDHVIIEKRQRMLSSFLQESFLTPEIGTCVVFRKFMDPHVVWSDVLKAPPVSILPFSNLLAPPLDPVQPSPMHLLLPQVSSLPTQEPDEHERFFNAYKKTLTPLWRSHKAHGRHLGQLVKSLGELGAYYNAFSLEGHTIQSVSRGIEKVGQAIDVMYLNNELLQQNVTALFEEPLAEMLAISNEALRVLNFKKLKIQQYVIIDTTIKKRQARIESFKDIDDQHERLEQALRQNVSESPTIAEAMKRLESQKPTVATQSAAEREQEVVMLQREIEKLNECMKVIKKDLEQVDESINKNMLHVNSMLEEKWRYILREMSRVVVFSLKESLESWEAAKHELQGL